MPAPHWFWPLPLVALVSVAAALCPPGCTCDDVSLVTDCTDAGLQQFPISLNPRLVKLVLTGNTLGTLDRHQVSFYPRLRELDLTNAGLARLQPLVFQDLLKLQRLSLAHNQLRQLLDGTLSGLEQLRQLDVSGNQLPQLSAGLLRHTPMLEELVANDNRLITISANALAKNTGLRRLSIAGNALRVFPASALAELPHLEALDLADNGMVSLDAGQLSRALPGVTDLNLARNPLSLADPEAFTGLHALRRLVLTGTGLPRVQNTSLASLTALEQLFIDRASISRLGKPLLGMMTRLKILSAQNCPNLTTIDRNAFSENGKLVDIQMAGSSQLKSLSSGAFAGLHKLRKLDLSNTGLQHLAKSSVPSWSQLESLQLSGCRLICDCSLAWLAELTIDTGAICEQPEELKSAAIMGLSPTEDLGCGAEERRRVLIWSLSISAGILLVILVLVVLLLYKYRRRLRRNMKGSAWGDNFNVEGKKDIVYKTDTVSAKSYIQLGNGTSKVEAERL